MNGINGMTSGGLLNRTKFNLSCGVLVLNVVLLLYLLFHPSYDPAIDQKLRSKTLAEMLNLKELNASWELENGPTPRDLDNHGWVKTLTAGDMKGVVRRAFQGKINWSEEIVDGWGTPFRITFDSDSKVHVISAGPDKIFGTADDITNQ